MNASSSDNEELVDDDEVLVMNFWDDVGEWPALTQIKEEDVNHMVDYSSLAAENIGEIKSENSHLLSDVKNVLPVGTKVQEEFILGPESCEVFAIARRNECMSEDESRSQENSDVIILDSDTNDAVQISNNHELKTDPELKLQKATTSMEIDISSIIISDVMTVVDEHEPVPLYPSLKQSVIENYFIKSKTNLQTENNNESKDIEMCKTSGKQKQLFECDICPFSTEIWSALSRHKTTHTKTIEYNETNEDSMNLNKVGHSLNVADIPDNSSQIQDTGETKKFKCSLCAFTSKIRFALKRHTLKHKTTSRSSKTIGIPEKMLGVKCRYCQFIAKNNTGLVRHVRTHFVPKCRYCSFVAKSNTGLVSHVRFVHNSDICKQRKIPTNIDGESQTNLTAKCGYCSFIAKNSFGLSHHVRRIHNGKPNETNHTKCRLCSFVAKGKRGLNVHILRMHSNNKTPAITLDDNKAGSHSQSVYKCKLCHFMAKNNAGLINHLRLAHSNVLKCRYCLKPIKKKNIKEHLAICRSENLFSCKKCGFKTKNKRYYLNHLQNNKELNHCRRSGRPKLNVVQSLNQIKSDKEEQIIENSEIIDQFREPKIEKSTSGTVHSSNQTENKNQKNSNDNIKSNDESNYKFGYNRLLYVCEICDYVTNQKQELISHKLVHSSLTPIKERRKSLDLKCITKFENNEDEKEKKSMGKKPERKGVLLKNNCLQCSVCKGIFKSLGGFTRHNCNNESIFSNLVRYEGEKYFCIKCQYCTDMKYQARRHVFLHKNYKADSKISQRCSVCNIIFEHRSSLVHHMINNHGLKNYNKTREKTSSSFKYECDSCDYATNYKNNLENHRILHINIKEIKVYKNKTYNVKISKNNSTTSNNHNNNYPSSSTSFSKRQNRNLSGMPNYALFSCDECPFHTLSKAYLSRHKYVHECKQAGKIYNCQFCKYKTVVPQNLKAHLKKHDDSTLLYCEYCPYSSHVKSNLQRHKESAHSKFVNDELTKHKMSLLSKSKVSVILFSCNYCGYKTNMRFKLKKHCQKMHPKEMSENKSV